MQSARLLVVVLLLAGAGGCMSAPPSRMAGAPIPAAADLDTLIYAKGVYAKGGGGSQTASGAGVAEIRAPVPGSAAGTSAAAPAAEAAMARASPPAAWDGEEPYRLDSGDRLRIVVFGQDGLSNSYLVDSSGAITMPLIKTIMARGLTTDQLARAVADRLRRGFIREPYVAIDLETYRPFFILGEVVYPGQYAYVPHMTAENAVAIAGGFTPRAYRREIKLDRPVPHGVVRNTVPPLTRVRPGDTIIVTERWF